jgi:hypothetical protein
MRESTAKLLDKRMSAVVQYALGRWKGKSADENSCYWVGETLEMESPNRSENGMQETTLILRGFTRGSLLLLEQEKEKIERFVPCTLVLADGTGVVIMYDYANVVPTGDAELKSMKINMTIQEWRVN